MLYRTPQSSVKKVLTLTGRQLASNKLTKSQRAAFAAMVLHGELELTDVTQAQLCRLFQVSPGYLQRAVALPAALRSQMAQGDLAIMEVPPEPTVNNWPAWCAPPASSGRGRKSAGRSNHQALPQGVVPRRRLDGFTTFDRTRTQLVIEQKNHQGESNN